MMKLTLPDVTQDDAVITALCKKAPWKPHKADWLQAYNDYRLHRGNPWAVTKASFPQAILDGQYKLYDGRKSRGALAQLRDQVLSYCPVCGASHAGDLDHVLPRSEFKELSICRANLVPACRHCNSGVKGVTYRGDFAGQRFIHPYFDAFAGDPLWYVSPRKPYLAASFLARPLPGLPRPVRRIVRFHLRNVLDKEFKRCMADLWAEYPNNLRRKLGWLRVVGPNDVAVVIGDDLDRLLSMNRLNAWETALYRGVLSNLDVLRFLAAQTMASPR